MTDDELEWLSAAARLLRSDDPGAALAIIEQMMARRFRPPPPRSDYTRAIAWLERDASYPRDEALEAYHYLDYYCRFTGANIDGRAMGLIMGELSRRGLVKRHKPYKTKAAYWTVESSSFPAKSETGARP